MITMRFGFSDTAACAVPVRQAKNTKLNITLFIILLLQKLSWQQLWFELSSDNGFISLEMGPFFFLLALLISRGTGHDILD